MSNAVTASIVSNVSYYQFSDPDVLGKKGRNIINGTKLKVRNDPWSGFMGAAWKIGDGYYVGFAGTNPYTPQDLVTDALLGVGFEGEPASSMPSALGVQNAEKKTGPKLKSQWRHARDFMHELAEAYPGVKFTATGHSLGGSLAQHVADEPNVEKVYAFNAPGFRKRGRIEPKVQHIGTDRKKYSVFGSPEFQITGEWIEGFGKHITNGKKLRISNVYGHGSSTTFSDAFDEHVDYRLRNAEQMITDGVISRVRKKWGPADSRRAFRKAARQLKRVNGLIGDYGELERIYAETYPGHAHLLPGYRKRLEQ